MADAIPYEKLFPVAPLIGTLIAVCFDVGYFYGVGVEYFTLFSLTEHIGFALEAIPVALAISIILIFFAAVDQPFSWYTDRIIKTTSEDISRPLGDRLSFLIRVLLHIRIVIVLELLFLAGASVYFWHYEEFRAFLMNNVILVILIVKVTTKPQWVGDLFLLLVMGCTAALLSGEFLGSSYIARTATVDTIVLKSGEAIHSNVIRSGERGVLYARPDQAGIVEFTKWDEIKSISRNREISLFDWQKK